MNAIHRILALGAASAALALASPAIAALATGAKAPSFSAQGARAGKSVKVDLASALKKGPVVLYFFPAAFTPGCNIEANAFAHSIADFQKAGATVIGMTAGNTDQLLDFSAKECAGKFTVAKASPALAKAYDVTMAQRPDWTDRTTYVIAKDGTIVEAFSDMSPKGHITRSLAAVRKLAAK